MNHEQSEGVGVSRLRKRVVFERLLARLQAVAPDGWFLKGGFALELRLGVKARTTKDVDIDWTLAHLSPGLNGYGVSCAPTGAHVHRLIATDGGVHATLDIGLLA